MSFDDMVRKSRRQTLYYVNRLRKKVPSNVDLASLDTRVVTLETFSGASVYKASDLTGQDMTTATAIVFDSEGYDTDSYHDTGSNTDRLTCSTAGYYLVTAQLKLANATATETLSLLISRYNSSAVLQESRGQLTVPSTTAPLVQVSNFFAVTADDFFRMRVTVEADTSVDIIAAETFFEIARLV